MEASEEKRSEFVDAIRNIKEENIVYIDESGIENNISKESGWGKKGKPIFCTKSGKYYKRTNIIAGITKGKIIAPFTFETMCNTEIFNLYIEKVLIKELRHGQVIVMDNASFHKSKRSKELIESVGCKILFLPPYSPDLNPIEKFWSKMKKWIRNKIENFVTLYDVIEAFFRAM